MAVLQSTLRIGVIDAASAKLRAISAQLGAFQARNRALMSPVTGTFARIAAFGGAYLGVTQGIRSTAGAALSFEAAMSDVRKVVDATNQQFAMMKRDIVGLSKVMPVTAEGFASIYAAAAQSGIANSELKGFAEGVVRVTNPPPKPNVTINQVIHNTQGDPSAVLAMAAAHVRTALEGWHSDGAA